MARASIKLLWVPFLLFVFGACSLTEPKVKAQPSPLVTLQTSMGPVVVELYTKQAPLSAGDFLRYVDEGHYHGAAFYRVVRPEVDQGLPVISVIQGGVPDPPKSSDPIPHETTQDTGIMHTDGTLSIARADPGTGSAAAFFITVGDQPSLDFGGMRNPDGFGFAAFGRVVDGMDVVRAINAIADVAETENPYLKGQILKTPIPFTAKRSGPG